MVHQDSQLNSLYNELHFGRAACEAAVPLRVVDPAGPVRRAPPPPCSPCLCGASVLFAMEPARTAFATATAAASTRPRASRTRLVRASTFAHCPHVPCPADPPLPKRILCSPKPLKTPVPSLPPSHWTREPSIRSSPSADWGPLLHRRPPSAPGSASIPAAGSIETHPTAERS